MTCASFHILDPCRIPISIGKPEESTHQTPKKSKTMRIESETSWKVVYVSFRLAMLTLVREISPKFARLF